ncbi:methyl jasmonate esterase 1-like [Arachis hypogaea]|uniref:methyl jasmonate esterase 1-like n=1 Tax=Arachis hypogaea TaxID=3818 RepID=UPI000789383E|nr:methylesterase 2-like [Arachis hypogaea]
MEQAKNKHHQTRVFILFLIIILYLTSTSGSSSPETSQNRKHHFVLVHGACHGAWSWYKVITLLKSWGHNVTALDLAASGVNQKQALELNSISEYFEPLTEFMNSLVGEGERVVLVGHSLGGLAITYAMEHFPHKISVAVFVTAFMPGPTLNVSVVYQMALSKLEPMQDNVFTFDDGPNNPPTTFVFGPLFLRSRLYQLSPKQDWILATTLMRPLKLFSLDDIIRVVTPSTTRYGSVNRAFIVSKNDLFATLDFQQFMIENNPPNRTVEIAGSDHMVMMSKPINLALQLQSIADYYD